MIKLQIPAGQANPAPPVGPGAGPARRQHHGVLQGSSMPDHAEPGGPDHPGGHHGLPGPVLHLHHQDARRRPSLLKKAAGSGQGLGRAEPGQGRQGHPQAGRRRSPRQKMADLNAHGRRGAPCASSRAPRAAWASRWSPTEKRHAERYAKQAYEIAPEGGPSKDLRARRGDRASLKEMPTAKFDETVELAVRLGVDPQASPTRRCAARWPCRTAPGKTVRVLVFARASRRREAEAPAPTSSAART